MTLNEQKTYIENLAALAQGTSAKDTAALEAIKETITKFKRAEEIAQELEQDFRELANLSFGAKAMKAGAIAVAKWGKFLEMGRIFLNI